MEEEAVGLEMMPARLALALAQDVAQRANL
jgi:hypothetical protein